MKKKLIYILIVISVVLLLSNVVLNLLIQKKPLSVEREINTNLVDSLFSSVVSNYNLDSSWINSIPISSNQYDSLKKVYRIKLPNDLRPAIVLLEIKNSFLNYPVSLISDEKIVNTQTTLNILSNNNLKLQATFDVDSKLERKHSYFSIVLENSNELEEDELEKLFYSNIPFSLVLSPSSESDSLIIKLMEHKKSYSILIDDGIEDDNYRLEPGFSKMRLKEAVRYISWNYPAAELFIIDDKSDLFNSTVINLLTDEFRSRNIELNIRNNLVKLPREIKEAESLLKFYLDSNVGKKGKILLMEAITFTELLEMLNKAKLRGTKFYSPSTLLKLNAIRDTTI